MKVFLRKARVRMAHSNLLEWSVNNQKWYPIGEKRVQASLGPEPLSFDKKLREYREKLNRVYQGGVEPFEGNYSVGEKRLTLKA